MKSLCPLFLSLTLTACHGQSPPMNSSGVSPPTPARPIYYLDPSPAVVAHDYARYRTWSWQSLPVATTWASAELLQQLLGQALEQRGLSFQADPRAPALYALIHFEGEQAADSGCTREAVAASAGQGPCSTERVLLRLQLFDSRDGQRVWNVGVELPLRSSSDDNAAALSQALKQALSAYPPD